jgi:hypothetical protein
MACFTPSGALGDPSSPTASRPDGHSFAWLPEEWKNCPPANNSRSADQHAVMRAESSPNKLTLPLIICGDPVGTGDTPNRSHVELRTGMTSKSPWMFTAVAPEAAPLRQDERCDVVVIGSGIAGLSTAYELSQRGRSVIVIDRGPIAGGMTARTSAHLAPLCDDLMSEMQKVKGTESSKLFYESQNAAVDRIEDIQKTEGIDCDFRRLDGYLFQGDNMPDDVIDQELDAVRAVGAPVERLMGVPFAGCEDRHGLRYPRQATFHPLKYLAGVAEAWFDFWIRRERCERPGDIGADQDRLGIW